MQPSPQCPPSRWARAGALCGAALLLAWPAAWNGYPLVFADTGTYLGQALIGYLGWDRPPFYSAFLFLTHWALTLWLPVLAQAAITAHLLSLVLRVRGLGGGRALLLAAAALSALTALPWFVAQLMPDLFTGLLVLALWLLGFRAAALRLWERLWLLVLATGAVAVHQSHLPLALGLALLGGALLAARLPWRMAAAGTARMLAPPLLAAVAMVAVNAVGHGRASLSPFGAVFFAARLVYDGPGMAYLRHACPEAGYRVCAVLDRLGPHHNAFLWYPESPLHNELGGAKAWAPEAAAVVAGTLREVPGAVARAMLANAATQFLTLDTGDGLEAWPGVPGPEPLIARFFPQELAPFRASRQQRNLLRVEASALAPLHRGVALAGLLALPVLLVLRRRSLDLPDGALILLVLTAALGNAAITGALSVPADRYQARIAWLFAFTPPLVMRPAALSRSAGRAVERGAAPAA